MVFNPQKEKIASQDKATCNSEKRKLISIGIVPTGYISIGIVPMGIVAIGVVPMGVISCGTVAMGVIASGFVSMGIVAVGGETMGLVKPESARIEAEPHHQPSAPSHHH